MVWFYHILDHSLLFIVLIAYVPVKKYESFFDGTISDTEVQTILTDPTTSGSQITFTTLLPPKVLPSAEPNFLTAHRYTSS